MPRKVQALSLSEFHEAIGPTTTADPAEVLPDGPSGLASDVPTRKWISEWDGRAELLPVEIPPPAAPTPLKTEPEFKEALDLCLSEFFSSGDLAEATRCVVELHSPEFHLHIVKRGVRIAMDKADREREMIAVLFATLHARKVLSSKQAAQGFQALAESLSDGDLTLDCPDAAGLLAHFLADAVLDGLLPASALREWPDELRADPLGASLLDAVGRRLNGRQPIGGSQVDPKEIVKQLHSCLEEYLSSHDVAEVERRLRELQIPPDRQHLSCTTPTPTPTPTSTPSPPPTLTLVWQAASPRAQGGGDGHRAQGPRPRARVAATLTPLRGAAPPPNPDPNPNPNPNPDPNPDPDPNRSSST